MIQAFEYIDAHLWQIVGDIFILGFALAIVMVI